jgi:hypothetical protein
VIRVASYRSTGPFAGKVIQLRTVQGDQQWRVDLKVQLGDQVDEHTIRSTGRIPLAAMREHVIASIHELTPPGATIRDARMDFFIEGRK